MMEQSGQKLGGHDRAWVYRQLVLACTLSLLAVLAFIVTAHAYVAKETKTTVAQFDGGSFFYTGLLDIPPDIDSVQLLPIGLTGDMALSTHPLPVKLANAGAIGHENFVYVVGGTDDTQTVRDEVYSTQTSYEGEITGWQSQAQLPAARAGAGLAIYPLASGGESVLYVVGGRKSNYQASDTVYRGIIDDDTGQVDSWELDSQSLPFPLFYASAVQHDGALYVIGGASTFAFDRVDYATINADGSLNTFTATTSLPEALYSSVAIMYDGAETDTLYVIGGRNQYTSTFKVYFADLLPGGGLSSWAVSQGSLPMHLYGHAGVYLNGEIILTGGVVNAVEPVAGISDTVKAALVDPENASFRLYDWCLGVPPPTCTIGAWQTGGLLPAARSLHGMTHGHGNVYVLGGQDEDLKASNTVYYGTIYTHSQSLYAPEGTYVSYEIDLGQNNGLRRLSWGTTIVQPEAMGISMQYRYRSLGGNWSAWSSPQPSVPGYNEIDFYPPIGNVRLVQYKAVLVTTIPTTSPLLDWVEIYYDVNDPEVSVRKDAGGVYTASLGGYLDYYIYYTNTGQWIAPKVVLTETLPANTTYAGGSEWQQIGSSDIYTHWVGDMAKGATGDTTFRIKVKTSVPEGTRSITNHVEIHFPPIYDEIGQLISDPIPENNWSEWSTPLDVFGITITKEANPPTSQPVAPGSTINYTVYYSNTGLRMANQAVLTEIYDLEGDYEVISANPPPDHAGHVWDLGSLAPGEGGQIDITVQLAAILPHGWPVTNQAVVYSPEGNPAYTRVLTHTVDNPQPLPDLAVTGIHLDPAHPGAGEPLIITADIANIGAKDAGPFWVELYVKPSPSSPPTKAGDHEGGYFPIGGGAGRLEYIWNPAGLASGMGASLSFPSWGLSWSDHPFPVAGTTYDVYVQIDVADSSAVPPDNPYWGRYAEADETNNILHLTYTTPYEDGGIYLPLVARH